MSGKKAFDCVEMKQKVQQRVADAGKGQSESQARDEQKKKVASNPLLAPFLRQAKTFGGVPGGG